ncbi:MAG TPA: EF-hand domain-containing protein [Pirellulales bacterium]|nr:EF-hand domain-containing protein [Pirellulales bacterium]
MKRLFWLAGALMAGGAGLIVAQPPAERGDGPGRGGPRPPLVSALDADEDGKISADEIKNAPAALIKLDKNDDGLLTEDEYRPQGRGPGGTEGGPRPEGGPGGQGRPRPDGGARPEGRPGRENGSRPEGAPGGDGRPRPEGAPRGDRGPGPEGRAGGDRPRPNPEQFAEHAMEFDADGDGKLDKSELRKMAESMGQRRGPPEGGDSPRRPRSE